MSTPTLEGPRLRLEPLTLAHIPAFEAIAYDDRNWRHMTSWIKNRADLTQWIELALTNERAGTVQPWITILKSTGQPIGTTSFLDLNQQHRTVEIGSTWLAPAYQATGLNPEAKLLQLDYAFDTLNLNRVAFKTHHENKQSQAALRKLGATYEGTFRNHYLMPDGTHRHSVWFSIIREDWPEVRAHLTARLATVADSPSSRQ
ncbi:GNAT family N-acetyltransferase [Granulicella arctica]|uniref:RimJ/RimL family protein N-acetyltransferase n=1 Tax=Granulicella arctica TaxID=940613 RepID=A0A7Y9TUD6_9BACT|nr:GNAT family protein [Granulicella arctica]NYF80848.1 RimJ/RimL family protein N-acetyltransferase [Granulicella arctica]